MTVNEMIIEDRIGSAHLNNNNNNASGLNGPPGGVKTSLEDVTNSGSMIGFSHAPPGGLHQARHAAPSLVVSAAGHHQPPPPLLKKGQQQQQSSVSVVPTTTSPCDISTKAGNGGLLVQGQPPSSGSPLESGGLLPPPYIKTESGVVTASSQASPFIKTESGLTVGGANVAAGNVDFIKPEALDACGGPGGPEPTDSFKDGGMMPVFGGGGSVLCSGCGYTIHEEFILKVGEKSWHSQCLRCSVCDLLLTYDTSCFIRDEKILCRQDYTKIFGTRCSKCCHLITQNDWIRRAGDQVFHLACFACDSCTRQLSTGEEFGLVEGRVLCKSHYLEIIEGGSGSSTDGDCCESEAQSKKRKSKRNRTTFTDEQIHILQANFQIDCNPDGQDLERIADISGLSKRVVQVWFQNARARNKKYISKNRGGGPGGGPLGGAGGPGQPLCPDQIDVNIAFSAFYSTSSDFFSTDGPDLEPGPPPGGPLGGGGPPGAAPPSGAPPCYTPPTQV